MFYHHYIYKIKDSEWLDKQRIAGKILSGAINEMINFSSIGKSTMDINNIGKTYILDNGGQPTFEGYKGFPCAICLSINKEIVHGIPKNDVVLENGDVLKIDAGVTYKGAIADMARTIGIGDINIRYKDLINYAEKAFYSAIETIKPNKSRLGDIGYAIIKEAKKINANVVEKYGGHGLDWNNPHCHPFVYNSGNRNEGSVMYSGFSLAIEPMLLYGNNDTEILEDGWTVITKSVGVHYENSVFIHNDNVEVIGEN